MNYGVIILPLDWRKEGLKDNGEVFIIKREGCSKDNTEEKT